MILGEIIKHPKIDQSSVQQSSESVVSGLKCAMKQQGKVSDVRVTLRHIPLQPQLKLMSIDL